MPSLRLFAAPVALLTALPCFAATVAFNARQDIATGFQHLSGYATGDFNGDGKPDLAFTDSYDKRVVVYLNDGKGGFRAPVSTILTIPNTTGALSAGDVNEDGKQDLIVATISGSQVAAILLSNGDGSFTQSGVMPNAYGFVQGLLVDVNGDKHLDFIASGNGSLYAAVGDGKGNFTEKRIASVGGPASLFTSLTVADFNKDGKPDLVVSTYSYPGAGYGDLRYFAGAGDGTFNAPLTTKPLGTTTYDYLGAADFNNDGKLDLSFSVPTLGVIELGNGDGTFQSSNSQLIIPPQSSGASGSQAGTYAPAVAIADFDNNGSLDVAYSARAEKHLAIALNDGTGSFPQAKPDFVADLQQDTFFLLTGDLNGDGLPDIVGGSYTTNTVQVFLSQIIKTNPSVTLTTAAAQTIPGGTVTLTAKAVGSGTTPTGSITFSDGSTSLGQVALDANGQAILTTTSLASGLHALTATYSGDARYNGSTSAALSQGVIDFTVSVANGTQTIVPGGTATYNVTVSGAQGSSGTVTLSCTGLPAEYACASSSTALASQSATATLTVSPSTHAQLHREVWSLDGGASVALAILPMGVWFTLGRRRRLNGLTTSCAVALTVGCVWLSGCSGGASAPTPVVYRGTTTFTINAVTTVGSQTLSHQTTATLTVQ